MHRRRFGVVVLAGGRATRFPGKLTADAGDAPLVVRVFRNFRNSPCEIVVASSRDLAPIMRMLVDTPVVVDAEESRGPVAGLLAAFETMRSTTIFAVAGDAPYLDAAFATRLAALWRDGDEALVPIHTTATGETRIEYLAALYDRDAFIREGTSVLREGRGALHLVIERLRARFVTVDDDELLFTNVNTPDDYAAFLARLAQETP
jgi:molybdopterin-guanine dinucleotide biosynthesis protein A